MGIKNVYSIKSNVGEIVNDIKTQLEDIKPNLIVFFASSTFNPEEIGEQMQNAFNESPIIGCTTAGEITSGKMLKNSVVAMAFDSDVVEDVKVETVTDIKNNDNINQVFDSFEKHFGVSMKEMDMHEYVGLILHDGLSLSEEKVMDKIGDLTNVLFLGGSAGDDLKFETTHVFANGKTYTNASVLALLKPTNGFEIVKTQSFKSSDKKLTATNVDEENRTVIEFNDKPAAQAYAEALETTVEDLSNYFMSNPVGLEIEDNIFVRSPQQVQGNNVVFYCNILEGMEVSVLESTDIVNDTRNIVEEKMNELDNIKGMINFHCILRTLELENKGLTDEYGQIFENVPAVGFSTYGESYIGHINQTSVILMFK